MSSLAITTLSVLALPQPIPHSELVPKVGQDTNDVLAMPCGWAGSFCDDHTIKSKDVVQASPTPEPVSCYDPCYAMDPFDPEQAGPRFMCFVTCMEGGHPLGRMIKSKDVVKASPAPEPASCFNPCYAMDAFDPVQAGPRFMCFVTCLEGGHEFPTMNAKEELTLPPLFRSKDAIKSKDVVQASPTPEPESCFDPCYAMDPFNPAEAGPRFMCFVTCMEEGHPLRRAVHALRTLPKRERKQGGLHLLSPSPAPTPAEPESCFDPCLAMDPFNPEEAGPRFMCFVTCMEGGHELPN